MKKIKIIISAFLALLVISLYSQPTDTLYFRFANPQVIEGATNDTLVFDVEIQATQASSYFVGFETHINFNELAFGSNSLPVEQNRLELVADDDVYDAVFGPISTSTNSFSYSIQNLVLFGNFNTSELSLVPTDSWAGLIQYKMLIQDNAELAVIDFDSVAMVGTTFFVPSSVPPPASQFDPVYYDNDLLNLELYPNVENLFISEIADPDDVFGARFVEIYNPNAFPVNFDTYDWFISRQANGSAWAHIQLTGEIPAMGTWVIGNNQTDFTANYGFEADQYSGNISGNGDDSYLLVKDDDYVAGGTLIDIYGEVDVDGTGEPWEYEDTKITRKYGIDAPNSTWTASEWHIRMPIGGGAETVDMTPQSHKATVTWTNTLGDQVWYAKGNWNPSYIPDEAHNVSIVSSPGPVIDVTTKAYCYDLNVAEPTARANANLTIESSPAGYGSLITYGSVTGNADVELYLPADRWNYITPPVAGAQAEVFLHTWMYTYDETTGDWDDFIVPPTTPLDVMRGYADWTSSVNQWSQYEPPLGDTTTMYNNLPLNNGTYSINLTYGSGTQGDGYNFTGNPYVSSVDWEAATGWDKSGLDYDGFVIWNGTMNAQYVVGTGGTNGATQYIPPQQGFFVQTSVAEGTFGMDNDVRAHSDQAFLKEDKVYADRLSLTIDDGTYTDETVIHFNENASVEKDFSYDADKFFATQRNQLYTVAEGVKRAINTFNNINETPVVNMGVLIYEEGEFTISASDIETFEVSTPLFLEDLKEELIINLRETNSYTFSATPEDDPDRFKVYFADPLGIDDPSNGDVYNIYAYDNDVYVNFTGDRGEIAVYNTIGQEVYRTAAENGLNTITLENGNSVYIVKVITEKSITSEKVFIR